MSTHFKNVEQRLIAGIFDWDRGSFRADLVWRLPPTIDPRCEDGCDTLPYKTVSEIPGLELAFELPGIELHTSTEGGNLMAQELAYSRQDLLPGLERMRREPGLAILGVLISQKVGHGRVPIILTADGGFPIDRAKIESMIPGDTLVIRYGATPVFSFI